MEGTAWNPWADLKARTDIAMTTYEPLPASVSAATVHHPDGPVILICPGLTQAERRVALAHELVHLEWGHRGCHPRHESLVDDEVADRLVPSDELREFWVRAEQTGQHVHPYEVAEHFHVPEDLAERAMRRLLGLVQDEIEQRRQQILAAAGWEGMTT